TQCELLKMNGCAHRTLRREGDVGYTLCKLLVASYLPNWRTVTALGIALVLVAGAYILARGFEAPAAARASTETALLQAIATKDSDGDGLPDWEEALYGTDPHVVDTRNLGMTDGE